MSDILNLCVDLDDEHCSANVDAQARREIEASGLRLGAADERTLAWIDAEFGGGWSREVFLSSCIVAYDGLIPVGFAAYDPQGLTYRWLRGVAREPGVGIFGPFGVAAAHRGTQVGRTLLRFALCALRERGFTRALIAAVSDGALCAYYERMIGAQVMERFPRADLRGAGTRTVMLASGSGSNVQAMIDAVHRGELAHDLVGVVSNRSDAYVLERARIAAIPAQVHAWDRRLQRRDEYDVRLLEMVSSYQPDLVLLLGWMHLLAPEFIATFGEILNIHPAFLPHDATRDSVTMPDGSEIPAFRGAHAIQDAFRARSPWVGASVHRVTAQTDRGDVLVRAPMRTMANEEETLVALHPIEHASVVRAVRLAGFLLEPTTG